MLLQDNKSLLQAYTRRVHLKFSQADGATRLY